MKKFLFFVAAALTSMSMLATSTTVTWVPTEADVTSLVSGTTHSVTVGTGNNSFEVRATRFYAGNTSTVKLEWANPGVKMTDNGLMKTSVSVWVDTMCNSVENIVFYLHTSGTRKAFYYSGKTLDYDATGTTTDEAISTTSTGYTPWTTFENGTYYAFGGKTGGSGDNYYDSIKVTFTEGTAPVVYTVTYYDGTTVLGTEKVKSGETPANYANYQTKAHYTFNGWYNEATFSTAADFNAAITADKAFYGKWTKNAFVPSKSLNIEQGVLNNGKAWDIATELSNHCILVNDMDALDSLNSSKDANNEPYLGLKMKKVTSYLEVGLNQGDILRVKFGNIGCALKATAADLDTTIATDAAKVFEYTATAQGYVKIANTVDAKTVTLKQIMINDTIQAVHVDTVKPEPEPVVAAAVLYEAVFSNGVKGAIYNDTVMVPYVGIPPMHIKDSVNSGARAAFTDGKIMVTNDTVTHVYTVEYKELTAPAFSADTVTFNGSETAYIYGHYGFDSSKGWRFAKNVNESGNMRITDGRTRIYMALPACDSVELVSATTARDIVVYLNGALTGVTNSGSFKLGLDSTKVNFIGIESNQTKGDGGFSKMILFKGNTPQPQPVVADTVELGDLKGEMAHTGSSNLFCYNGDTLMIMVAISDKKDYIGDFTEADLATEGCFIKKMILGSLQPLADGTKEHVIISANKVEAWFVGSGLFGENHTYHFTMSYTPLPSAVEENVAAQKAVKMIVNGQILIRKGNKLYNVFGAEL